MLLPGERGLKDIVWIHNYLNFWDNSMARRDTRQNNGDYNSPVGPETHSLGLILSVCKVVCICLDSQMGHL